VNGIGLRSSKKRPRISLFLPQQRHEQSILSCAVLGSAGKLPICRDENQKEMLLRGKWRLS
jgi:hypothetical protein